MQRPSTKPIIRAHWALALIALLLFHGCTATKPARTVAGTPDSPPSMLFIIMDDVGIDQMKLFGYGGATPPRTPNIDAIARAGVRFRNFWAMPECSPSRAVFFEGRYPLRTNVLSAILNIDLANSKSRPLRPPLRVCSGNAAMRAGSLENFTSQDRRTIRSAMGHPVR